MAGLAAALLACVPLVALSAGRWSYHAGVRAEHAEMAWRQVRAVLLAEAPDPAAAGPGIFAVGVPARPARRAPGSAGRAAATGGTTPL